MSSYEGLCPCCGEIECHKADAPAAEPKCPECGTAALYECVACSATNYPAAEQPQGEMVLVPREPTDEMLDAAMAAVKANTVILDAGPAKGATLVRDPHYHVYRAMLSAAPSRPVVDGAINALPAKWRKEASKKTKPGVMFAEHRLGLAESLDNCADELESILAGKENA